MRISSGSTRAFGVRTLGAMDDDESDDAFLNAEAEARYTCPSCGEEIVVPIDVPAGSEQEYVEDCPVCCSPNLLHVEVDEDGAVSLDARPE